MKINMRKNFMLPVVLALTLAAGLGLTALAGDDIIKDDRAGLEADPEFADALVKHVLKRFYSRIEATDAQKTEITELVMNKRAANAAKRKALKDGLKDFMQSSSSLDNSTQSDKTLRDKAHTLRAMHEELMDDRLETFLKIRATLTAEQKDNLKKFCKMQHPRLSKVISAGADS